MIVSSNDPSKKRLIWFLFYRILILTIFLGCTIIYHLRIYINNPPLTLPLLYILVVACYLEGILSAIILPKVDNLKLFTQSQIVWDIFIASSLIYLTGGIESHFSFLFILIIFSSSMFFNRKEIFITASASSILYGSLLDLQYYGYLPLVKGLPFPKEINGRDVFYAVIINCTAFLLTAFLSSTLTEKLRKSEQALEKQHIDYEELEKLNQTILANINSGLMIVNSNGHIRSFNESANKITGYTLEDVYDKRVENIFPNMNVFLDNEFNKINRGECTFIDSKGGVRILGFASTLVHEHQEKNECMLITFQDLTHLKDVEDQLKRADRLAALGRLAAGMAHEIRNPLTSIAGPIQLLIDSGYISEEDRKLMKIVVKESKRLNTLLSDFLSFAQPNPLQKAEVDVSALLDELTNLVKENSNFSNIKINCEYQNGIIMNIDRDQFHQAIWNLIMNAIEAMESNGILSLGISPNNRGIFIEDMGLGISEDIRDKIFEPFFTTKNFHTGLGLAIVYSIVERHGGEIRVISDNQGKTRFSINLPNSKKRV